MIFFNNEAIKSDFDRTDLVAFKIMTPILEEIAPQCVFKQTDYRTHWDCTSTYMNRDILFEYKCRKHNDDYPDIKGYKYTTIEMFGEGQFIAPHKWMELKGLANEGKEVRFAVLYEDDYLAIWNINKLDEIDLKTTYKTYKEKQCIANSPLKEQETYTMPMSKAKTYHREDGEWVLI